MSLFNKKKENTMSKYCTEENCPNQSRPGKRSVDRVKFKLTLNYTSESPSDCQRVVSKAFNVTQEKARTLLEQEATIVCRPSQFARFIIMRNEAGITNWVKNLNAELFIPEPESTIIDVSSRPRSNHG